MQKWHHKQSKKYISKVSVGFVKCYEWRVACNRPTLASPQKNRRGNSFWSRDVGGLCRPQCLYDVTTILASVCVVSLIKVLLSCSHVLTASCDTLWHNTDAISIYITIRRPCVATACLSVSDLPPPSTPSFTAELNGPLWHHDNR